MENSRMCPEVKKGIKSSLDLKGSTFKPFQALDISTIHELLLKIEDETMTIKEAMMQCGDIKKLHKIQQAFVKGMELDTWEKAVEVYPQFATAEKLEPFKHLNFSKAELPPQFLNYCQYIKTPGNVSDINTDKLFSFNYLDCTSIFWKNSVSNITVNAIDTIFTTTTVRFTGFTLAVLDYAQSNDTDTDQMLDEIKTSMRIMRGVNYSVGKQHFTVIVLCYLSQLSTISAALNDVYDETQMAVCSLPVEKRRDVTSVNSLNEVTIGMLVAKSGVPAPLPMERDNFFLKTKDQSYYDASTGRLCFSTRSQLRLYYNCTQHLLTGLCYCQLELVPW
ncbi:uncharacterized protein [Dysidea avara]|uniref:uncharacterized protein n=1 Tax=Dysidea avara TaxID=196820 RepID=UPI003328B1FE